MAIPAAQVLEQLLAVLREAFDGPADPRWSYFTTNAPGAGLLGALEGVDAALASRPVGGTSVAAHVHHEVFALEATAAWIRGDRSRRDWSQSWRVQRVDTTAWEALRQALRRAYEDLRGAVQTHGLDSEETPAWAREPSCNPPGPRDPREAAAIIAEALRQVFGQHLQAALLKGSVVKGDVLPFFSDLDVHALIQGIGPERAPPWSQAVAFQTHIGALDPEAYGLSAFQVTFLDAERSHEYWAPPWPGTYEVLVGSMPAPGPVDAAPYVQRADADLRALPEWAASVVCSFVDKPDRALPRLVRLAGAYLKGALYDVGIVLTRDPGPVLTARLPELVALVGPATQTTEVLEAFYARARSWLEVRANPTALRAMFGWAMTALEGITAWHGRQSRAG
ncbi:MAG: hypothetical protein QN122_01790 [Armatimonadota bacterium]|nr:hypothetical protein [Armatimonadota bacterium]MDR7448331.1 hypothetical protein [Armatimonadota bacterium]MDR7458694.1 hypothetical protein [Armatimonadota bacterium]MDR7479303.1 hypothetical protein [Armatimonadota bacterium]MDR7487901.1 hypothetical protein [Armatimonadota bacterium]